MTIPNTARKAGPLLGTGSQTAWPFTFKVFAAGDVQVTIANSAGTETLLVLGTDYTVTLNSNQDTSPGGTVNYPISGAALPVGSVLAIIGDLDYDQPLDLPSGGNFSPLALENQLDRATMQIQQLKEEVDRSAKLPPTSAESVEALVDDLQRIADSADNLDTVAGNIADINTVASDLNEPVSEINTVAASITNVNTVGNNITNVNTVAGISANVTTVAGIAANVTTVAGIAANVTAVAGNATNINAVAGNATNINAVNANKTNIDTVSGNTANVTTVAGVSGSVTTVAGISADVQIVADNVTDITNFADVYQGPKASDPALRNDGSALQVGDLYFNTAEQALRTYGGTQWVAGTAGTMAVQNFSGNGSATAFTLAVAPASENNTQVFIGGVYQQKDQYSVSGTTLTFSTAPTTGTNNIEVVTISTLALGETDAALVSFVQADTGAVERTVQGRLRESVSVKDFGAVGDGVADDTASITTALNTIKLAGGTVFFPKGVYYVPNGINFYNTTPESNNTYRLVGQGSKESLIKTNNAKVSLDLGGRNRVHLIDIGIVDLGASAEVGIARYREQSQGNDGGGQYHYYENLYMEGKWTKAAVYSLASEVNTHVNLEVQQIGSGAAYYTASTNLLGATLAGTLRSGYTSNTANTFLGGALIAGDSAYPGVAVYFGSSSGNFQMFGTYLVGTNFADGGAIVKFGNGTSDAFIENYNFSGCRFEGYTDAFKITASFVEGLNIRDCVFGQDTGKDINWTNSSSGAGLKSSYIVGNYHKGQGLSIPVITSSRIAVAKSASFPISTLTVNNGNVSESHLEGGVSITGATYVYATVIVDVAGGEYRHKYGPNSKTSPGNSQGSVIVNQPFGSAPTSPRVGTLATAGVSNWEPTNAGATTDIPVFYDGSIWRSMVPVFCTVGSATATGVKGTTAIDASYLYVCTATNTWKRIALTW